MSKSASSAHRVPPYKRPILIGGFLLILAAVVGITIVVCKQINKSNKDDSTHLSSSESTENSQPQVTTPPDPEDDIEDKTPQYEGQDPNDLEELTGVIIYKDIDVETQTLHSAVTIDQYLQDEGQCVYSILQNDVILRTTSAVIAPDVTTSVCGPIALSIDGLPPGIYQITVNLSGEGKQGSIIDQLEI